ncbi:MAG: class I SAM-dependent RNA methyltransferase [Ichthyobacteriaceae bacterium]|nr:class I SAM-dependent RNA methyltransferase [Ichthyobacteriaceae bacterium]
MGQQDYKMIAKTLFGLEEVLEKELMILGAKNVKTFNRGVEFEGDKGFMYKANLWLRTALRILKPINHFKVKNEDQLYRNISSIAWEDIFDVDSTFAIDATVMSDHFRHSQYAALRVKDAIVDRFKSIKDERPNVDTKHPNIRINIHISHDECTVSLDSSGDSLHKRGYKTEINIAPINEVLAAGMIKLSGWEGNTNFVDPMCGSGTILVEAAMIALNIPAGIHRKEFGFERWKDFDEDLFELIREKALDKEKTFHHKIIGYDIHYPTVTKAHINIENALFDDLIEVEKADFFDTEKPEGPTLVMFNPPYGERLEAETPVMYKSIGDTLKQGYQGADAWIISSDLQALKNVGLKTSRKVKLFNGKLETRFVKYEMYAGTKRTRRE